MTRRDPALGIDTDVPHAREIDDQAVVDCAVTGGIVASAPDRDLETSGLAEGKGRRWPPGADQSAG